MNRLQELFETTLEECLDSRDFALKTVVRKIQEHGITLSKSGEQRIEKQLLESGWESDSLVLEDEDIDTNESKGTPSEHISLDVTDADIAKYSDEVEAIVADMIPSLSDSTAESMLATIKRDAPSMLKEQRVSLQQFEDGLRTRWEKPLDLLELFISIATEAGADFNCESRKGDKRLGDAKFEALTRLHARACQVASETLVLLRSGYADGAHARWRTLYEIAVVSSFIRENDQDLAERYLLHEIIQQYKLACQHQIYKERLDATPLSQQEFDELKATRDQLLDRYGPTFDSYYGWAASTLGVDKPNLFNVARNVKLEHMIPYYKMASDNVHAHSHGATFRLGSSLHPKKLLLAGPSIMGLSAPGHSTAISLHQVTVSLLTTSPNLDCIVALKILMKLLDEIGDAFLEVHCELEALAEAESQASDNGQEV